MRIKRFASLAFPLTLTAFMACSQSGSPLGPEDDASESAQSEPQTASGSEFAMASSAPEAAVPESQGGETQPVETGTAGSESEAGESSEPGAQSVVDSVLAEVAPSPSEASATPPETGSAAVPSDESAEARGAFKA